MCWSNSEIQFLKNKGGGETTGGIRKGTKGYQNLLHEKYLTGNSSDERKLKYLISK